MPCPTGAGSCTDHACTIKGAHFARITVADTGSGIRDDVRKNLFTQFFTTKGSRGTGLGLWLTRDIVLRNQGRLRYRPRPRPPAAPRSRSTCPRLPRWTWCRASRYNHAKNDAPASKPKRSLSCCCVRTHRCDGRHIVFPVSCLIITLRQPCAIFWAQFKPPSRLIHSLTGC